MKESPIRGAATDPVCGMIIDPAKAAGSSTHDGETFFFCSHVCRTRFDAAPEQYAAASAAPASCCSAGHSCC